MKIWLRVLGTFFGVLILGVLVGLALALLFQPLAFYVPSISFLTAMVAAWESYKATKPGERKKVWVRLEGAAERFCNERPEFAGKLKEVRRALRHRAAEVEQAVMAGIAPYEVVELCATGSPILLRS